MTTAGNKTSKTAESLTHSAPESAGKPHHTAKEILHDAEHALSKAAAAVEKKAGELGEKVNQGAHLLAEKARGPAHRTSAEVTKAEEEDARIARRLSDSEQSAVRERSVVSTDKTKP